MCVVYVIFPVLSLSVLFDSFYLPAWFSKERERERRHSVGSVCMWGRGGRLGVPGGVFRGKTVIKIYYIKKMFNQKNSTIL